MIIKKPPVCVLRTVKSFLVKTCFSVDFTQLNTKKLVVSSLTLPFLSVLPTHVSSQLFVCFLTECIGEEAGKLHKS